MRQANLLDLAWAAGVFEGEGTIYSTKGRARRRWHLRVSMTDHDIIARVAEVFGVGSVSGPYQYKTGKPYWNWGTTARGDVGEVVRAMLPWLGKRRYAKAMECLREIEECD